VVVLEVRGVSKKFASDFRLSLRYGLTDVLRRSTGMARTTALRIGEFWAVNDVTFDLHEGESLGLLGPNGSGKTTILRLINGGYLPTFGSIRRRGRIGALIALGAGISPNMSGRENVHLLTSLMGLSRKSSNRLVDEIINFSGLHKVIDRPAKGYSSGMIVRLGFSAAVAANPQILLIDEVLAVGDIAFQKRCTEKLISLKNSGTAMLIVSHSMHAVWSSCDRAIVFDSGASTEKLPVDKAIQVYERQVLLAQDHSRLRDGSNSSRSNLIVRAETDLDDSSERSTVSNEVKIRVEFELYERVSDGLVRLVIGSALHPALYVLDSYEKSGELMTFESGRNQLVITFDSTRLRPGEYHVDAAVVSRSSFAHLLKAHSAATFKVLPNDDWAKIADNRAVLKCDFEIQAL